MDIKAIVDQLITEYKEAITTEFESDAPAIIAAKDAYLKKGEKRLKNLALSALSEDENEKVSYAFVVRRLEEELITAKDIALGIEQMIAADSVSLAKKLLLIFKNILEKFILNIAIPT